MRQRRVRGVALDARKVAEAIESEGRTTKWLAEYCKCSKGHLLQALNGSRPLSESAFTLLAQALCREPSELMAEQKKAS